MKKESERLSLSLSLTPGRKKYQRGLCLTLPYSALTFNDRFMGENEININRATNKFASGHTHTDPFNIRPAFQDWPKKLEPQRILGENIGI